MKPEEVIELLKIQRKDCTKSVLREDDIDYAIAALEKQIPKKPKTDDNRILCPECNLLIAYNKSIEQHCWTCGQNLEGCVIK